MAKNDKKPKKGKAEDEPEYDADASTEVDPSGKQLPREVLLWRPNAPKPEKASLVLVSSTDANVAAVLEDEDGDELHDVVGWHGRDPRPPHLCWTEVPKSRSTQPEKTAGAGAGGAGSGT